MRHAAIPSPSGAAPASARRRPGAGANAARRHRLSRRLVPGQPAGNGAGHGAAAARLPDAGWRFFAARLRRHHGQHPDRRRPARQQGGRRANHPAAHPRRRRDAHRTDPPGGRHRHAWLSADRQYRARPQRGAERPSRTGERVQPLRLFRAARGAASDLAGRPGHAGPFGLLRAGMERQSRLRHARPFRARRHGAAAGGLCAARTADHRGIVDAVSPEPSGRPDRHERRPPPGSGSFRHRRACHLSGAEPVEWARPQPRAQPGRAASLSAPPDGHRPLGIVPVASRRQRGQLQPFRGRRRQRYLPEPPRRT